MSLYEIVDISPLSEWCVPAWKGVQQSGSSQVILDRTCPSSSMFFSFGLVFKSMLIIVPSEQGSSGSIEHIRSRLISYFERLAACLYLVGAKRSQCVFAFSCLWPPLNPF